MEKKHTEAKARFIEAILALETVEECEAFFEDIFTIREIQDLSQRWQVAQMLDAGKNYQEVSAATGASTATICRVNKCLTYGEGYRAVLEKATEKQGES